MTTITKQQVEKVLEYFGDKTLTKGCLLYKAVDELTVRIDFVEHVTCGDWHPNERINYSISSEWFQTRKTEDELFHNKDSIENYEVLGHPILIGDVLFEMGRQLKLKYMQELCYAWGKCGFTKSLQELYAECEWVQVFYSSKNCGIEKEKDGECTCGKWRPKQKPIRELFEFLLNLNLTE